MRFKCIFYIACCGLGLLAVDALGAGKTAARPRLQESVRGYLVDNLCLKEEAARLSELGRKHTRKCLQMPSCRESGYGLLLPATNDVLRFDKHGNDLAVQLINSKSLDSGWLLQATGNRKQDQFAVTTLELVSPAKRKRQGSLPEKTVIASVDADADTFRR